ncbi:MAG: ribonuclease P protein component [Rubripirellula sp.]
MSVASVPSMPVRYADVEFAAHSNGQAGSIRQPLLARVHLPPTHKTIHHQFRWSIYKTNMRYSFGKTQRVTRSGDFTKIIRLGTCVADGTLVLFALSREAGDEAMRIGITIPKKTGNAVVRNRWKRLIRESFRQQQAILPAGYEFIVRPKRGASPNWIAIQKSIPRLARKAAKRASQANSKR